LPETRPFPDELIDHLIPDLTPEQREKVFCLFDHAFNHPWVDDECRASIAGNICNGYDIAIPKQYEEDGDGDEDEE